RGAGGRDRGAAARGAGRSRQGGRDRRAGRADRGGDRSDRCGRSVLDAGGSADYMARAPLPGLEIGGVPVWPPLLLAPMAGATDSVLPVLFKRQGAGLVCPELTSSHGAFHGNEESYGYPPRTEGEPPIPAQVFGAQPHSIEVAGR